jgi:peptidoglycan/xylan/chitin deacetylase (PgdA/CDA1 family)
MFAVFLLKSSYHPQRFPVFMYHTSSENNPGGLPDLYVKPSEFEKQIEYLTKNGYEFCTFDDWENLPYIKNPVFITFDDGYYENYTEIYPILKKYGAKITIFLVTEPSPPRLADDIIREMSDSGLVKFESHTKTHANLAEISSDEQALLSQLKDSKTKIEEITSKPVVAVSYPQGLFNGEVISKAREFYKFGVSVEWGMHKTNINNFTIRRFSIDRGISIEEFIKLLKK